MDLLKSLLQGNGSNPLIGTLLPLLLGGKKGGTDVSTLLSLLGNGGLGGHIQGTDKGEAYPPLFGDESRPSGSGFDLLPLLQTLSGTKREATPSSSASNVRSEENYPYELQYNRPEKANR